MYKSLEHLIREIKEGKCCCDKKKDSLEGAIRKVVRKESSYAARDSKPVEEDVGGLVGSGTGGEGKLHAESGKKKKVESEVEDTKLPKDIGEMNVVTNTGGEMLGRQYNTRSAIIAPRKDSDDGHGQAAKNVSIQRRSKIEKFSAKNVSLGGKISEENVDEQAVPVFKFPPKINLPKPRMGEPARKLPEPEPAPEPVVPKPDIPDKTPGKEPMPAPKPDNDPAPAPAKPSKPAPAKPAEKPAETPEPVTKPGTKTAPVPQQAPAPEVAPSPVTKPATKLAIEPAPQKAPAPGLAPVPATPPVPAQEPAKKQQEPKEPSKKGKFPFPFIPFASAKPVELSGPHAIVSTSLSRHRGHRAVKNVYKEETEQRKKIEDMPRKDAGDRHVIQYVGRKDADPKSTAEKTSRQAQYKVKVIDEAKKLADVVKRVRKESGDGKTKVYDNVVINPDLNRPDNKNDADLKP